MDAIQKKQERTVMGDAIRKKEMENRKNKSDETITGLVDQYLDMREQLGEDHFRTNMYKVFVELLIPLKEITDTIIDMENVVGVMDEVFSVIDLSMDSISGMMNVKNQKKYTVFTKIAEKLRFKKFLKNMHNRIESVMFRLKNVGTISKMVSKDVEKLNGWMRKNLAKQKVQETKKGTGAPKASGNAQVDRLIQERIAARESKPNAGTNANTAPASSGMGGNIDDIT